MLKSIEKWFLVSILTVVMLSAYIGVGVLAAPEEHVLKIAVDAVPSIFNPLILWMDACQYAWMLNVMYEPLVYMLLNGTIIPWLAKSWEISKDGTRYVFHLDERARWSDGRPVTAEDVVVTWNLTLKIGMQSSLLGLIKEVNAIDTYTVEFVTTQPWANWWNEIGGNLILPAHIWSKIEDPMSYNFIDDPSKHVTTSPFKYDSFRTGEWYLFKKRGDYWKTEAMPRIDGILFKTTRDTSTYPMLIESGEVDVIIPCPADLVDRLTGKPNIEIWQFPIHRSCQWLACNQQLYPLNIKEVRHAIDLALDKERIARENYQGRASPADLIPINLEAFPEYYSPEFIWPGKGKSHEENVAEANRILDALGFQKGPDGVRVTPNGTKLEYIMITGITPESIQLAESVAANLMEIGIKVSKFEHYDIPDMIRRTMMPGPKDFGFTFVGVTEFHTEWESSCRYCLTPPEPMGPWHTINWNVPPEANEYARRAYASLEREELVNNVKKVLKIWADELPFISVVYFTFARWAYRTDRFTNWHPELSVRWGSFGYATPMRPLTVTLITPIEEMPPVATPTPTVKPTPAPTPTPAAGLPTEQIITIAIIIIIVIAVIGYLAVRARRKSKT